MTFWDFFGWLALSSAYLTVAALGAWAGVVLAARSKR